jgi:hypothetical protein
MPTRTDNRRVVRLRAPVFVQISVDVFDVFENALFSLFVERTVRSTLLGHPNKYDSHRNNQQ